MGAPPDPNTSMHFPHAELDASAAARLGRWIFPAFLDNPSCPWLRVLKDLYDDPRSFPSSLAPEAGLLLHALVRNLAPRRVIETGTYLGVSSLWIAAALDEAGAGELHSFDNFEAMTPGPWRPNPLATGRLESVTAAAARAGLADRVRYHPGNCPHALHQFFRDRAPRGDSRIELAFLDADHSFEGVRAEFRAIEPHLAPGGYLVLHDTSRLSGCDGPSRLVADLPQHAQGQYALVDLYTAPVNFGMVVLHRWE
ncbi:MAG: class I SAM-dependent methyltransferase [Phycisphaerae bacterium]|nr:class I SAM-dependent methyltransferase [Phycisphaerae bacterium]